jgi:hypothetical protein
MTLPAASGGASKWISFYILSQILKSRREAFCSFSELFLGEAKRKIAHCLRAFARALQFSAASLEMIKRCKPANTVF